MDPLTLIFAIALLMAAVWLVVHLEPPWRPYGIGFALLVVLVVLLWLLGII